jgi:hypothetical protein
MRGILADVNVQGHLPYLRRLIEIANLQSVLDELKIEFATFADLPLDREIDDRLLWNRCQADGWVLFTDNRNRDDVESLEATLEDSWREGHLPVFTIANKGRFERDREYAMRAATDVAELLFGIAHGEYRDTPRIYVPRQWAGSVASARD